ncbi:MAG: hypothetical protein OEV31_07615 [Gammaproteobacteria bacterium]|nr:hypothetical protein [Gammaproteobacteria bacterium]
MLRKIQLGRTLFFLFCAFAIWCIFCTGYYFAFLRAEQEKLALVTGDIRLMKYVADELRRNNTSKALQTLEGMVEVKGIYAQVTNQLLNDLTIFDFAAQPAAVFQRTHSPPNKTFSEQDAVK